MNLSSLERRVAADPNVGIVRSAIICHELPSTDRGGATFDVAHVGRSHARETRAPRSGCVDRYTSRCQRHNDD
jgi:hypothetical protein